MKILITGANGFVGRNLVQTLRYQTDHELFLYDINNTIDDLTMFTKECDFVFHLAGVNRPTNPSEFYEGNAGFTEVLCRKLKEHGNQSPIVITSSIQAMLDNDYGKSKKEGEMIVINHGKDNQSEVYVYRLTNLFGKWCRPNYNSVVATWCHNIASDLPVSVSDPSNPLTLCYIDDVVREFLKALNQEPTRKDDYCIVPENYDITLGWLLETIQSFKTSRETKTTIETGNALIGALYATYLSYLPTDQFAYPLKMNVDHRGSFTEFLKTELFGQVSVNISKPGITKGNHWHHTKNEKFLVVSGEGIIRFRKIDETDIIEYKVSGETLMVVDIPTGYTHNIENVGTTDLVTIMWASEQFDPNRPDTMFEEV